MAVRFKKTEKGEVAILPREEYEMLVARAKEADEDAGTAWQGRGSAVILETKGEYV